MQPGDEISSGSYLLTNDGVNLNNGYVVTSLTLSNMEEPTTPALEIQHYQFIAWKGGVCDLSMLLT